MKHLQIAGISRNMYKCMPVQSVERNNHSLPSNKISGLELLLSMMCQELNWAYVMSANCMYNWHLGQECEPPDSFKDDICRM